MLKNSRTLFSLFVVLMLSQMAPAGAAAGRTYEEREWGLGMIMRGATIPFATDETRVASLVPMMWYQGERVYFLGTEGGVMLFTKDKWRISAMGRMHFFDIPSDLQNEYQGNTVEAGLQARYEVFGPTYFDAELMTDFEGNSHLNFRYGSSWESKRFQFHPYAELKLKNRHYNSYYFGLDRVGVAGGGDLAVGFVGTYHFTSNFYGYGAAKFTLLDRQVRDSEFVNKDGLSEVYLGLGLSNDRSKPLKPVVGGTAFWRVAHGWATPSSLADIIHGQAKKDVYNNQMTSVFYGHPLTDQLFGLPLDLFVNGGLVWHHKSDVQDHAQEVVANIKLFYTIPLPVRVRLGAAEGVSYVNSIPYVEESQLGKKGYKPSKLLNFLDFSVGLNLGDIAGGETMKHWWLGYSIHHRSAIFESAQHFGRIKGGSNFQTVYLQWHY
ncbi:MAG: MipA/OmpV family protein [Candidatus Krumholzibacteria bacterium]|nr:MipA/OmpV family protein [Candidatus Krumholzibacteria bacterium]